MENAKKVRKAINSLDSDDNQSTDENHIVQQNILSHEECHFDVKLF